MALRRKAKPSKRGQGTLFESFLGGFVGGSGEPTETIKTHGRQLDFGIGREPDKPSHKKAKQGTLWNPRRKRTKTKRKARRAKKR